jgi:HAD superfamily hydrolase (TIGR01490 family)
MRKAAFFDVDGTLTKGNVWRAIMDYFQSRNQRRFAHAAFWAYHAPLYFLMKLGIISQTEFRRPWAAHLAWYFKGMKLEQTEEIWDQIVNDEMQSLWRKDSLKLLAKHKSDGDLIVLVSAGPTPLEEKIAQKIGAHIAVGTDFEIQTGRYTGRKAGIVCLGEDKAILAKAKLNDLGIEVDFATSFSYADSAGDVAMLEMVGNPVALHPDEQLLPIAKERGWNIVR